MKPIIRRILYIATAITILALIIATIVILTVIQLPIDPQIRLEYMKFYLEIYKAIGIGFLVAVLGAIIPQVIPEAKFTFDNIVKGREYYTKTKTGIDYLPYKLPYETKQEAISCIEKVHQAKHLADIYTEEPYQVTKWPYNPYDRIVAYRTALINCPGWDKLSVEERFEVLQKVPLK